MTCRVPVSITYSLEPSLQVTNSEINKYINMAHEKYPGKWLSGLKIRIDGEFAEIRFKFRPKFDVPTMRIKRGCE